MKDRSAAIPAGAWIGVAGLTGRDERVEYS